MAKVFSRGGYTMKNNDLFDIYKIIDRLKEKRPIFVSEADFQLELAWTIKEEYPHAKIRLEYCPQFDINMHIDILVIIDNKWIPIELKYKTKNCSKIFNNEAFNLKNHGAKNINCYLYLKDIERIEKIKNNESFFYKGYTILVTNDMAYVREPLKDNSFYKEFSVHDGNIKSGLMSWGLGVGNGTIKNIEKPIKLSNSYKLEWNNYSVLDNSNSGTFKILINEIN